MPDHDFITLSPDEFECLARDLLEKEWGVRLETLKAG
jgi:hypothetical protein